MFNSKKQRLISCIIIVVVVLAMVLVGCGAWCSIEASKAKKKPPRVRGIRSVHSNAVKFCEDMHRQLEREAVMEKSVGIRCAKIRGKGAEEFKKGAEEVIHKTIYPVW